MNNKQASYWLKTFEPLIGSLHARYSDSAGMGIDDIRQEAWIAIQSSKTADVEGNLAGFLGSTIRNRISNLARGYRARRRAEQSAISGQLESYDLDRLLTLRRVLSAELTPSEQKLAEMLARSDSKGQIMRKMGKRRYYQTREQLRGKITEAMA